MIITNFRGVSSKNSNFVEKLMIRIIFVVDVLRLENMLIQERFGDIV